MAKALSGKEIEALILGASIYSTGGGGSVREAFEIARQISEEGLKPTLIPPVELKDDDLVFNPAEIGGGVREDVEKRFEERYGTKIPLKWERWPVERWIPQAVMELKKYLGRKPDAYIATELGPGALLRPLYQAAVDGLPVVDGDLVGRSVPEMTMQTLNLKGIYPTLSVAASHFGDVIIIKKVADYKRLEDILRFFAECSGGGVGYAEALSGSDVKKAILPLSYTKCMKLGLAIKDSVTKKKDVTKTILEVTKGYLLFKGKLTKLKQKQTFGHLLGELHLIGVEEFARERFKVWFKNENHIARRDGRICALSPDIIAIFDQETGEGVYNFDWAKIDRTKSLAVVGIPAPEVWRSKEGISILGPGPLGLRAKYEPVELLKSGKNKQKG
jgi:DUF917 family protein